MEVSRPQIDVKDGAARCPFCHDAVRPADDKEACKACMAWHHAECWSEHGGCGGCGQVREAVAPDFGPPLTDDPAQQCEVEGCRAAAVDSPKLPELLRETLLGGETCCREHGLARARARREERAAETRALLKEATAVLILGVLAGVGLEIPLLVAICLPALLVCGIAFIIRPTSGLDPELAFLAAEKGKRIELLASAPQALRRPQQEGAEPLKG